MGNDYIVSARKYRPSTFATVVGQSALTRTLRNAIATGRVAQAYLFCGPRGVGKTTCARIFAKTLNCSHRTPDGEACGQCESCLDFDRQVSFNVIELDAASNNGVDQMRELTAQVNVPPTVGRYRVFIIDEVHMLSTQAFNAFLKTLEEPPSYAVFILATTEKNKVLPTILSRCQIYDFARITEGDIAEQLAMVADAEGIGAEPQALALIARKADGAMRDALSIFDQVAASASGSITYDSARASLNVLDYEYYFRFVDAFRRGDVPEALLLFRRVSDDGFDARFFINGLASHLRNLLVSLTPQSASLVEGNAEIAGRYAAQASSFKAPWYYTALGLLADCDLNFRHATDKRLLVEVTLIRLCQLDDGGNLPTPSTRQPLQGTVQPDKTSETPAQQPRPQQPGQQSAPQPAPGQTHSAAVSPASIPSPRPQAPRAPQQRTVSRPAPSLRLKPAPASSTTERPSTPSSPDSEAPPADEPPLPHADIRKAWQEYIDANAEKNIMVVTMGREVPEPDASGRMEMTADHPGQLQEVEQHLAALSEHMRVRTGRPELTVTCRLASPRERSRKLTPAEQLRAVVEKNPVLGELLTMLDVEQI